jgi:ribose transport system permease protein
MFVCAAIGGKLILADWSFPLVLGAMVLAGAVYGAVNGFFITRFKIMAFIVTLATLYFGRGLGLWITQTRAMNLPESFYELGAGKWLGVHTPVAIFLLIILAAHGVLAFTPFGRRIYAVGHDEEIARKAGIATGRLVWFIYVICGVCAAIGGIVALSQSPAVSPTFGIQREFAAIAAAVIGGTSLFGGRGKVFPGTVMGAVLIQTIENGLVIMNANPYSYPIVSSLIIFLAVTLDCYRTRILNKVNRRKIRLD